MEKGSSEGEVGEVLLLLLVFVFVLLLMLFELLGWELVLEWEPGRFIRVDVDVDVGKVICG